MPQKRLVLIGTICGVVSLFLIGLFLLNVIFEPKSLSDAEKRAIFAEIIKNNSNNLFGRNSGTAESLTATADSAQLAAPLIFRPEDRDYNYKESTMTYSDGPAIGECKFFNSAESGGYYTTKSYEFYGDGSYATKYIYTDSDGDLSSYTLTKSDEDASETIEYRGGNYAMRWSYNLDILRSGAAEGNTSVDVAEPTVELEKPASTSEEVPGEEVPPENNVLPNPEIDYDSLILQYFGEDADIVDVYSQNGKTYYVVQYSYEVDCSQEIIPFRDALSSSSDESSTTKILVQNVVDSESFEFVKSSNYLNAVSNNNLLNSYSTVSTTRTTTLAEVASNFEFEYDVELRTTEPSDYDPVSEAENLVEYLSENDYTLILLENSEATLQSAYSYKASQKFSTAVNYLLDRSFYANTSKGEAQYNSYVNSSGYNKMPLLSVSYAFNVDTTYDTVNIDMHSSDVDVEANLKSDSNTEVSDMNLTINGANVAGKLYTHTYEVLSEVAPSNNDGDQVDPVLPPDRSFTSKQLYLEYEGFKYVINFPSRSDFDISTLTFRSIETNNPAQLQEFGNNVVSIYRDGNAGGGTSSSGAAEPKVIE